MTLLEMAREAAFIHIDMHVATLDKAPTEHVIRTQMAPFAVFLRDHPSSVSLTAPKE